MPLIVEFEKFMAHRRYQPHITIIFIKTCRMEMVNHTIRTISCYLELKYSEILWCAIRTLSSWFEVFSTGIITASAAGLVNMPSRSWWSPCIRTSFVANFFGATFCSLYFHHSLAHPFNDFSTLIDPHVDENRA